MKDTNKELLSYIDTFSLLLLGVLFLLFPVIFTSQTTDAFGVPKQMLLAGVVLLSLLLLGTRALVSGKLQFRSTPFNLPVVLFTLAILGSALFSVNQIDSLVNFFPVLYGVLLYFITINVLRRENAVLFALATMVIGGCLASIISILSFLQIYLLPYSYTHTQLFTPLGSLLDQAIYLALIVPLAAYGAFPLVSSYVGEKKNIFKAQWMPQEEKQAVNGRSLAFGAAFLLLLAGLGLTLYLLVTKQPPTILPFFVGFQTAFAEVSQNASRYIQSFLFGAGYGEYLTVFTRFKQATYNANPILWSFTFFRSSTFFFELLATTGILGVASFVFLGYRIIRERAFFIPMILALVAAFFLPFSFTIILLFFVLLSLFVATRGLQDQKRYHDLEYYFLTMRQSTASYSRILPGLFLVFMVGIISVLGYFTARYFMSDVRFQSALVAAQNNQGLQTYNLQREAIGLFPYRDSYLRIFSQTNLALANSLAQAQPKGSSPSADIQQNILNLIQQSVDSGRGAVRLSPLTALNWNNLGTVYRSLIGFGQDADKFAISMSNQAILLDPENPQQYINLGGIYYQLGDWTNAQNQFQLAINAKRDYANGWYNLGHALENKGELQNALAAYQNVKTLVANDAVSTKKINAEIDALEKKIGSAKQTTDQANSSNSQNPALQGEPINVNQPKTQLPERKPRVDIPEPSVSPAVKATPTPAE